MKRSIFVVLILITTILALRLTSVTLAQTKPTATPAVIKPATNTTAQQSTVSIFFVACGDKGIVELSGNMRPGYDIFYQVFSQAGGGGKPLTSLRQVSVNGTYAVSDTAPFENGATLPSGGVASVKVLIARESDSSRSVFSTTVNDLQDGCVTPKNPTGTATNLGTSGPVAESTQTPGSGVLSPFGGEVNPGSASEPPVKIGAREIPGRSNTPGLIFAECDNYPLTNPGVLYDTDDLVVFWSWFAKTSKLVQDHIDHAQYQVTLNQEAIPNVQISPITQRGRNFFVFYVAHLGRFWQPGGYGIEFRLSWDQKISDGYADYGPGTTTENVYSTCTYQVQPNPWGLSVVHIGLPFPKQP